MYSLKNDPLVPKIEDARLCNNETVDVWNIDSDTTSGVYQKAMLILHQYDGDPYSNLVTQQIETSTGLEYNGVLYVHVF